MRPPRIEPGPGQESVWDYPRPPRGEPTASTIVVSHGDSIIAHTTNARRVLETSQPPAFYIPRGDINFEFLVPSPAHSFCEWKGEASYYDLKTADTEIDQIGWTYVTPNPAFTSITHHLAFYAQKLTCSVDGEVVNANEGSFYGGWITSNVVGPFKGSPGSSFW